MQNPYNDVCDRHFWNTGYNSAMKRWPLTLNAQASYYEGYKAGLLERGEDVPLSAQDWWLKHSHPNWKREGDFLIIGFNTQKLFKQWEKWWKQQQNNDHVSVSSEYNSLPGYKYGLKILVFTKHYLETGESYNFAEPPLLTQKSMQRRQ